MATQCYCNVKYR